MSVSSLSLNPTQLQNFSQGATVQQTHLNNQFGGLNNFGPGFPQNFGQNNFNGFPGFPGGGFQGGMPGGFGGIPGGFQGGFGGGFPGMNGLGMPQPPTQEQRLERFTQIDANGDGSLSADEMANEPRPQFAQNLNLPEPTAEMKAQRFQRMDANGDSQVSQEEFLAGPPPHLRIMQGPQGGGGFQGGIQGFPGMQGGGFGFGLQGGFPGFPGGFQGGFQNGLFGGFNGLG